MMLTQEVFVENYIIVGFIILIVLVATGSLVKRAGRKGCCGSIDYIPRKKKLKKQNKMMQNPKKKQKKRKKKHLRNRQNPMM